MFGRYLVFFFFILSYHPQIIPQNTVLLFSGISRSITLFQSCLGVDKLELTEHAHEFKCTWESVCAEAFRCTHMQKCAGGSTAVDLIRSISQKMEVTMSLGIPIRTNRIQSLRLESCADSYLQTSATFAHVWRPFGIKNNLSISSLRKLSFHFVFIPASRCYFLDCRALLNKSIDIHLLQ